MTIKESIAQLTNLATTGYDSTIDCFSIIATDNIQEFGGIRVLKKLPTAQALKGLLETAHSLDKAERMSDISTAVIATKKLVATVFPEVHVKAPIPSPRELLASLIDLAREYRNIILLARKLEYSGEALKDIKVTLIDLQQAYDEVKVWSKNYPAVIQLKDTNHITSIGGLITAIEREAEGIQRQRARSGDTTVLDIPTGAR